MKVHQLIITCCVSGEAVLLEAQSLIYLVRCFVINSELSLVSAETGFMEIVPVVLRVDLNDKK